MNDESDATAYARVDNVIAGKVIEHPETNPSLVESRTLLRGLVQ